MMDKLKHLYSNTKTSTFKHLTDTVIDSSSFAAMKPRRLVIKLNKFSFQFFRLLELLWILLNLYTKNYLIYIRVK